MLVSFPAAAQHDGYEGLIPPSDSSGDPLPEMTPQPGYQQPPAPRTSDDLKILSLIHGEDEKDASDLLGPATELPPDVVAGLARPGRRIQGMLPEEYTAAKKIELLMGNIRNKKIPAADREKNIEKAYAELSAFADAMRSKKAIPDKIYLRMGLPESNIREKKEAADSALQRLEKALNEIEGYRK